jgi:hypothetical protein
LKSTLRDRSRSTSCNAGHDGVVSSGSSNSFSIHAEKRFSVARFHELCTGQMLPGVSPGGGGRSARTVKSRLIVPHSAGPPSRVNVARQVPAAGDLTSVYQKKGGPPWRSRDLTATLPSGSISESSPSSGFSTEKMTRNGAPFHGTIGEGNTASPTTSSQLFAPCARASPAQAKNAHAASSAVAGMKCRARDKGAS